jgi:hypothetical protein
MAITIKKVSTKRELKKFIRFNYRMYKGNPYSVPDLYDDMLNTFNKKKNAAFEFCEADYFLAYRDDKIVGRVAAIINNRANEKWECKNVRFGWIDFIDDPEVSSALIKTVEDWGKERGMTHITGPLGFTDFDAEGMLIEGFDQLSTMATIYNHPYYPVHMERLGFEKDADWVEYKIYIPDAIPDKHKRISELIQRKYNLKIKKYTSGRKIAKDYGQEIFELMNEAYSPLYGYSPLTQPVRKDVSPDSRLTDGYPHYRRRRQAGMRRHLHAVSCRGPAKVTRPSAPSRMVLSAESTVHETPCQNA